MRFLYSKLHPFGKNYILEAQSLVLSLFCSASSKDVFFTSTR